MLLSGGAPWAWPLLPAALAARFAALAMTNRAVRAPMRRAWLLPLSELIAFGIFVASFSSSRVVWRGFSFDVGREGRLCPAPEQQGNA